MTAFANLMKISEKHRVYCSIYVNKLGMDGRQSLQKSTSRKNCDYSPFNFHEFQIGNSGGMKWESGGGLHDSISVVLAPACGYTWRIEREVEEPLWSFHLPYQTGENKKLYVSYDEHSNDVTLEFEDRDGSANRKLRLFTALLQPGGGMLLRAEKTRDRFLRSNGKHLEMVMTQKPTKDMEWLIKENFEKQHGDGSQPNMNGIQVKDVHQNREWIAKDAVQNYPIPVQPSSASQKWLLTRISGKWTFEVADLPRGHSFYACNNTTHNDLSYDSGKARENLRQFEPTPKVGGVFLKTVSDSKYLAVNDDGYLMSTEKPKHAVTWGDWDIVTTALSYFRKGEIKLFPPLFTTGK